MPIRDSAVVLTLLLLTSFGRSEGTQSITVQPLANPDFLEPSVLNEVDHALSLVPKGRESPLGDAAREFAALYATNGMNATELAISLVSSQKNGDWYWKGTNVTPVAVWLLRRSAGYPQPSSSTSLFGSR